MEELPDESAYRSALLEDRDLAEAAVKRPTPEPGPLSLRGYSPLIRKIDDLIDAVFQLAAITAHAKPSDAPSVERPKPEIEYVRTEMVSENLSVVVAYLLR